MKVLAFPGPRHQPSADAADTGDRASPPGSADPGAPAAVAGEPPRHYDRITVRAITIAIALSIFVHLLLLVTPWLKAIEKEEHAPDEPGTLSVSLSPPRRQTPAPTPQPTPDASTERPTPRPPQPQPPKPRTSTPVPRSQIAVKNSAAPPFVVPPPTMQQPQTPQAAPTPQPPVASSFEEELAIRQRNRRAQNGGAPDEAIESDNERANRIAKANILAQQRSASPGQDPNQSGGIFDLKHTGLTEAEFVFNGWNRDFRRGMGKTFEVRATDGDIRMAVIRQMISIIREQQPGDFTWYGTQHKEVVMSARPQDQKELELFLMREFYPQDPRSQTGRASR